jgi:hypothetical protein
LEWTVRALLVKQAEKNTGNSGFIVGEKKSGTRSLSFLS